MQDTAIRYSIHLNNDNRNAEKSVRTNCADDDLIIISRLFYDKAKLM